MHLYSIREQIAAEVTLVQDPLLTFPFHGATIMLMEVSFNPEVEATLKRIAQETGRGAEQVVVDLVSTQLDYDAWFRQEVQKGIDSLDRGEFRTHEEVGERMQRILRP